MAAAGVMAAAAAMAVTGHPGDVIMAAGKYSEGKQAGRIKRSKVS